MSSIHHKPETTTREEPTDDTLPPPSATIDPVTRVSTPIGPTDTTSTFGELVETARDSLDMPSRLQCVPNGDWMRVADGPKKKVYRGYGSTVTIETESVTAPWTVSITHDDGVSVTIETGVTRERAFSEAGRAMGIIAGVRV